MLLNVTDSSYNMNKICKNSILNDIFYGPRKSTFSRFFV